MDGNGNVRPLIAQVRDSLAELAAGEAEVLSKEDIRATLRA